MFECAALTPEEKRSLLARPRKDFKKVFEIVEPIIEKVTYSNVDGQFDVAGESEGRVIHIIITNRKSNKLTQCTVILEMAGS